jgi:hypothetical protein
MSYPVYKKLLYDYDELGRKTGMWQVAKTDINNPREAPHTGTRCASPGGFRAALIRLATEHKAMKERIARTASRHGLDVQTEARSADGRVITDVLVTGDGGRIG